MGGRRTAELEWEKHGQQELSGRKTFEAPLELSTRRVKTKLVDRKCSIDRFGKIRVAFKEHEYDGRVLAVSPQVKDS